MSNQPPHKLWFDRIGATFRLPLPVAAPLLAFLPFVALLTVGYYLVGRWNDLLSQVPILPVQYVFMLYLTYAARFVTSRTAKLVEYAKSMGLAGDVGAIILPFYSLRRTLGIWLLLNLIIEPFYFIFGSPPQYTLLERTLTQVAFFYYLLIPASFVWPYAYSMYAIYRVGKQPLNLKFYAEDRTLGLRPFGALSLQLTSTYMVFPLFGLVLVLLSGIPLSIVPVTVGFVLGGFVLFALPLISLRKKLVETRKALLDLITPRYALVSRGILETDGVHRLEERLSSELGALETIRKDVRQIHSWPFDVGILARLVSITVLPLIITVIAREVILLTIHV